MKNRRKISIISSLGSPPYLGGIENVIDTLLHSQISFKYQISIYDTYRKPNKNRKNIRKVNFLLRLIYNCYKFIKRENPCIVHIHFCSETDFWKHSICLLIARMLNVKTIFHLHGGSFDQFYNKKGNIGKKIIRICFKQADTVIALSDYWKEFLRKITDPRKIEVVPNPIDCQHISEKVKVIKNSFNNNILLLGSLGRRKGHYDTLKAIRYLSENQKNVTMIFAGLDEDEGATENLKKLSKKYGVLENVKFAGAIIGNEKFKALGEAEIVILPSYGENMPISVLEGMAAAKPIIATMVGAIPEVIEENKTGYLIKPGDWETLAKRISYLLENKSEGKRVGTAASKIVKEKYDIKIIESIYDRIYKKYLNS